MNEMNEKKRKQGTKIGYFYSTYFFLTKWITIIIKNGPFTDPRSIFGTEQFVSRARDGRVRSVIVATETTTHTETFRYVECIDSAISLDPSAVFFRENDELWLVICR